MSHLRRALLGSLAIALGAVPLRAEVFVTPGEAGFPFLRTPVAARPAALGGAFTAVAGDLGAMEYNPAGLATLPGIGIAGSLGQYFEDAKLQSISAGIPIDTARGKPSKSKGDESLVFGLHYRQLKQDDTERNSLGAPQHDFDVKQQVIQGALAYTVTPQIAAGVGVKLLNDKIQSESASGYAFDGGVLYQISPHGRLGLSITNWGSDIGFGGQKDPLPTAFRSGVAFDVNQFLFLADVAAYRDRVIQKAGAVEWRPHPFLVLRAGVFHADSLQFTGGLGLRFNPSGGTSRVAERPDQAAPSSGHTLSSAAAQRTEGGRRIADVRFGLDYAIRTHRELGLTHTATFTVLY
jgi:hypothetical protein